VNSQADILRVIAMLYAAALDDKPWKESLDSMSGLFGAVGVSYEIFETVDNAPVFVELSSGINGPSKQEYIDYYGAISPRVAYNVGKPTGFISYDSMILSESEMDRDEYYADFMGPMGLRYFLAAQVYTSASHQAVFAAHRTPSQGHVGEPEMELMRRLAPHLKQATDLKFRLAARRSDNRLILAGLDELGEGCVLIDAAGHILHLNSMARELISQGDGIDIVKGRLSFADESAKQRYRRALGGLVPDEEGGEADVSVRDFATRRRSGGRPYLISIRPIPRDNGFMPDTRRAAGMIFLRDPERFARLDADSLRQSYKLSEAEVNLALVLDAGSSLRDVAREREVSIATVRSQLYSLMSKLGVRRQVDLARLLGQYRRPFT